MHLRIRVRGILRDYTWRVVLERLPRNEAGDRKIFAVFAVGAEFIAAHDFELRQRFAAVCGLPFATWCAATGAAEDYASDHSRICRPPARARAGEEVDCAETGGAAVVFQVLRARGDDQGESRAACAYTQVTQADSFRAFCRRHE